LRVLDLTDARVREILDVSESELTGDDLTHCQKVAEYARKSGYDAIFAPAAALEGQRTVAVFSSAMRKITEGRSRVGPPPARVRRLLGRVRL
jgi:RES domain-containing protein